MNLQADLKNTDAQFIEIKIMSLISIYSHKKKIHGICMRITNFTCFYDLAISISIFLCFYASFSFPHSLKESDSRYNVIQTEEP